MSMKFYVFNTYVDAVLVRRVIIGLGNCSCELFRDLFGELSGDDIFTYQQFFSSWVRFRTKIVRFAMKQLNA